MALDAFIFKRHNIKIEFHLDIIQLKFMQMVKKKKKKPPQNVWNFIAYLSLIQIWSFRTEK